MIQRRLRAEQSIKSTLEMSFVNGYFFNTVWQFKMF